MTSAQGGHVQTCTDSYRLIGRLPLLPGVEIFVALTENFGLYRLDIRTWVKETDGVLFPTPKGFNLTLDQMRTFARLIAEVERLAIEAGEWVDLEEEAET